MVTVKVGNVTYTADNSIVINDGEVYCDGVLTAIVKDKNVSVLKTDTGGKEMTLLVRAANFWKSLFSK